MLHHSQNPADYHFIKSTHAAQPEYDIVKKPEQAYSSSDIAPAP
jgi:hypothetical protein